MKKPETGEIHDSPNGTRFLIWFTVLPFFLWFVSLKDVHHTFGWVVYFVLILTYTAVFIAYEVIRRRIGGSFCRRTPSRSAISSAGKNSIPGSTCSGTLYRMTGRIMLMINGILKRILCGCMMLLPENDWQRSGSTPTMSRSCFLWSISGQ